MTLEGAYKDIFEEARTRIIFASPEIALTVSLGDLEGAIVKARIAALKEAIPFCCGTCAMGSVPFMGRVTDKLTMFPEKWVHAAKADPRAKWACMAGDLLEKIKELERVP